MKEWKTTLAGVIGGVAVTLLPILQSGKFSWQALLTGAAIGVLGVLARDFGGAS
jgi:hypothetical protein